MGDKSLCSDITLTQKNVHFLLSRNFWQDNLRYFCVDLGGYHRLYPSDPIPASDVLDVTIGRAQIPSCTEAFPETSSYVYPGTLYLPVSQSRPKPGIAKKHHTRREPGRVRRPPNAFILFRSSYVKNWMSSGSFPERSHSIETQNCGRGLAQKVQIGLSKHVAVIWRGMSEEDKEPYRQRAIVAQHLHKLAYPDYRYCPRKPHGKREGISMSSLLGGLPSSLALCKAETGTSNSISTLTNVTSEV